MGKIFLSLSSRAKLRSMSSRPSAKRAWRDLTIPRHPEPSGRRIPLVIGCLLILLGVVAIATVAIYGMPNTQAIMGFHQYGGGPKSHMGYPSRQPAAITNGLVGWWKMDEGWTNNCSTATVIDSSVSANNGTSCPNGTGPIGGAAGKFGRAGYFDGSDDYVSASHVSAITLAGHYTFSVWINPVLRGSTHTDLIFEDNTSGSDRNGMTTVEYLGVTTLQFGYYNGSAWTKISGTVASGQWSHVVGIDNNGTLSLYINGVAQSGTGTPYSGGSVALSIGRSSAAENRDYYQGYLDDIRIYNRALSAAEVTTLYRGSAPPACDQTCVGYWKLDETSGTNAADSSGFGNTGTVVNTTFNSSTTGVYSGGLKMNQNYVSNQYVDAGTSLAGLLTNKMTISFWAYRIDTWTHYTYFYLGQADPVSVSFPTSDWQVSGSGTTGAIAFAVTNASGTINSVGSLAGAQLLAQWIHIVGTYDGSNLYLYVNGTRYGPTAQTGNIKNTGAPYTLSFGKWSTNLYSGILDDVRIYNRALAPYEIYNLYAAGR